MVSTDVWQVEQEAELLTEYGKVCVRWAAVDFKLYQMAAIALNNDLAAQRLIMGNAVSGRQRFEALKDIVGASGFDQTDRAEIFRFADNLLRLQKTRNDIVHSPLLSRLEVTEGKLRWYLVKFDRKGRQIQINLGEVREHVAQVGDLLRQIEDFIDTLIDKYV
ncbi:hypothetical protein LJR030_004118 [Rhizobium sp. LjRoot30]|uniref:hypothetical protein n=1 Tax=Rhizobium sp. LjRoot30 TaxID=3342320 RepID=UPI000927411E|nr:MAG: hypothetical protein BGN83_18200 [Rhizobium sp. 63-7]